MSIQSSSRTNYLLSGIYFFAALTFLAVAAYMAQTFEVWSPLLLTLSAISLGVSLLVLLLKRPFLTYCVCALTYIFAIQQGLSSIFTSSMIESAGLVVTCTIFFSTPLLYLLLKRSKFNQQLSLREKLFSLPTFSGDTRREEKQKAAANS